MPEKIAYSVNTDYGSAKIRSFTYEKSTPLNYTGCKEVETIHGGEWWIGSRVPKESARETARAAVELAITQIEQQAVAAEDRAERLRGEANQLRALLESKA